MKSPSIAQPVIVHQPSRATVSDDPAPDRADMAQSVSGGGNKPISESLSLQRLAATCKGHLTRQTVRVKALGEGMIHTRIAKVGNLASEPGAPVDTIRSRMKDGAVYDSVRIRDGRKNLEVATTPDGMGPGPLGTILRRLPDMESKRAYISGGFFVHGRGFRSDTKMNLPVGYAVGETKWKDDRTPVPSKWEKDYAPIQDANGTVLIHSGPTLEKGKDFSDDRFHYRLRNADGKLVNNPDNKYAGALTHANDNNQRAAISLGERDVRFHTLTTAGGNRTLGATMSEWSEIVNARREQEAKHINLDGSRSVNMGTQIHRKTTRISSGTTLDKRPRTLVTVLATHAGQAEVAEQPVTREPTPRAHDGNIRQAEPGVRRKPAADTSCWSFSRLWCFPSPRHS